MFNWWSESQVYVSTIKEKTIMDVANTEIEMYQWHDGHRDRDNGGWLFSVRRGKPSVCRTARNTANRLVSVECQKRVKMSAKTF